MGFFNFYSTTFDYHKKKILMDNQGSIVNKYRPNYEFSLMSPQDPRHDIGSAAFKIRGVFDSFRNRYRFVKHYNFEEEESILKFLINPQKLDFISYFELVDL